MGAIIERERMAAVGQGVPESRAIRPAAKRTVELGLDDSALARAKHALVPGCGKGYDVALFASYGLNSTGLEIAPDAVEQARNVAVQGLATLPEEEKAKHGELGFVTGDFYKDDWAREEGYDYVYDDTVSTPPLPLPLGFAFVPELVKPGSGYLICLEFPLYKPLETGGPPWGLTSAVYEELLSDGFDKIVHYKAQRTHKVGEGSDYIAVWRRKAA